MKRNLSVQAFDKAYFLHDLARLHLEKWQKTGDIKLLKIAHDLKVEAAFYLNEG
jgi:hypothetical protein